MAGLPSDRPIPGSPLLDPAIGTPTPPVLTGPIPAVPPAAPPALPGPLVQAAGVAPQPPTMPEPQSAEAIREDIPEGEPEIGQPEEGDTSKVTSPDELIEIEGEGDVSKVTEGEPVFEGEAEYPPKHWFQKEDWMAPIKENVQQKEQEAQAAKAEQESIAAKQEAQMLAKMSPEQRQLYLRDKELSRITREKEAAAEAMAAAEQAKNAKLYAEGVQAAQDQEKRIAAADEAMEKAHKEATDKRQALDMEAIKIANTEIDPNRGFTRLSAARQIALVAAAGIQGFLNTRHRGKGGAAAAGAGTPIIDVVNGMLERDMQAQAQGIANRQQILGQRRSIVEEQWNAEKDMRDHRYKSAATYYEIAKNKINAISLQYDNPRITAKLAETKADLDYWKMTEQEKYERETKKASLDEQQARSQMAVSWANAAETQRHNRVEEGLQAAGLLQEGAKISMMGAKGPGTEEKREARLAGEAENARAVTGKYGETLGLAKTPEDAVKAKNVVQFKNQLHTLAIKGKKLFAQGWSPPGTPLRAEQESWVTSWAQVRRFAAGDTSAPNATDRKNWGIDEGLSLADKPELIMSAYEDALGNGRVVLRQNGISTEALEKEGFLKPKKEAGATSRTEKSLFMDDDGNVSDDPRGRPLDADQAKAYLEEQARIDEQIRNRKAGMMQVPGPFGPQWVKNPWAPKRDDFVGRAYNGVMPTYAPGQQPAKETQSSGPGATSD